MQTRRGFTIVEMVVTMAIMAILLTLTVVSLNQSQVNARNAKRKADAQAIARGLEVRYKQGNPRATQTPTDGSKSMTATGQYPGINEWYHVAGFAKDSTWNPIQIAGGYLTEEYSGTSSSNFSPPTSNSGSKFNIFCTYTGCTDPSTGTWFTEGNATNLADAMKPNNDNYVYEPIGSDGTPCSNADCVRFNLYYHLEGDPATTYQVIKSDHQ